MKAKRILTFILSLIMLFTCSVALAEEPAAEKPLESDNELSVIMDEEIEIVQAEALLGAAPEDEPEDDADIPDEEDIPDEDEDDPSEDVTEDEDIPDEDDPADEQEDIVDEPEEEPVVPEAPVEEPSEEPVDEKP